MLQPVIISYSDIGKPGGLPEVLKRLVADLSRYGNNESTYFLHDFKEYYRLDQSGFISEIDANEIDGVPIYVTIPWVSPLKMLRHLTRRRMNGEINLIWPWGMFCRQQYQRHWNEGKKPLFLKKIYILTLKRLCLFLSEGFMMHSSEEAEFSGIPLSKCALVTMGRPPSKILDDLEGDSGTSKIEEFSNDHFSFVGRGQYHEKGISKITTFAASPTGKKKKFRFFCSTCDPETQKHIEAADAPNEIWDFKSSSLSLVPYLRSSQAYITVSDNPIQLRTPYEVLCLGTPVITQAESMMEGMQRMFARAGFPGAIQIVDPVSFEEGNFEPPEMRPAERMAMAQVACALLHPKPFAEWLDNWLGSPRFPADFYSDASIEQDPHQSHF